MSNIIYLEDNKAYRNRLDYITRQEKNLRQSFTDMLTFIQFNKLNADYSNINKITKSKKILKTYDNYLKAKEVYKAVFNIEPIEYHDVTLKITA